MRSLVVSGILIISSEVLLKYICVYYCIILYPHTINNKRPWYNIFSAWFKILEYQLIDMHNMQVLQYSVHLMTQLSEKETQPQSHVKYLVILHQQ